MSKPKSSIRDYGYQPNMATDLWDMESTVTTDGMRMAGKVEKHSEFMEPNTQPSYQDMEYNYPYPPSTMPPISWVGPGIGWPPAGGPDYTPEMFNCWAYYCCCATNVSGPIKVTCTYPIVEGPWVRNSDGTTCTTQEVKIDSTEATLYVNPCGDANCPPDVRCKIQSPAQEIKGKKKYPGQIKEMKVTMIESCGKVGSPPCPPVSACCTGVSISGMTQMNVGTSQTLTILNPVAGCNYEFRKSAGGGTVTTAGVYTAPATNPGCTSNATIGLYDKTNCVVCATITIAINGYSDLTAWAVTTWTGKRCWEQIGPGTTICDITNNTYNCAGELVYGPCAAGRQYWGYTCAECYETNTIPACYGGGASCNALEASSPIDRRNEAMKAAGCCPAQLL